MTNPQHEALVEAVARALYEVSSEPEHGDNWETMSTSPWGENFRLHAIAALSAATPTPSEEVVRLRDLVATLHYECLGFVRHEGSLFDTAMTRAEAEFGNLRAIAALSATAAPPSDEEVRLRAAVRFLLDRLVDHEVRMTSDEDAREWYGHVTPAMERARAALEPKAKDERPDFVAWRSASFAHRDIIEVRERNGHTHLMQVGSPQFNAALIDLGDLMPVRTATAEQRKPWFRD